MSNTNESIKALVVHCIDYRFVALEAEFIKEKGLNGSYDLIAYPGAAKNIATLFDAVATSIRLHNPQKILVINHEDCGAFGVNNSITDHKESLEKAEKLLKIAFPNLAVETYLAKSSRVEKI